MENKIKWESKKNRSDTPDFRAKGFIVDVNGDELSYSLAARPDRKTGLYIGQIRFSLGFSLMTVARKNGFSSVGDAINFVTEQFNAILVRFDGLVKSQMQDIGLEILKENKS